MKTYLFPFALSSSPVLIILGTQEAGMFLRRYTRNKDGKTQEIDAPYMIDTYSVISIVRDF